MTPEEALLHIRYTGWASRKLLDAARQLPADLVSKDQSVSHQSILGTLAHTFFGDSVWYMRTVDTSLPYPDPKSVPDLETLASRWEELLNKWEAWAQTLTEADFDRSVAYRLRDGSMGETSVKHVILHLVNHATLHRGQVMALIRQAGVPPPPTDLIFYYRELAAPK